MYAARENAETDIIITIHAHRMLFFFISLISRKKKFSREKPREKVFSVFSPSSTRSEAYSRRICGSKKKRKKKILKKKIIEIFYK
jgi:hypothetical protein